MATSYNGWAASPNPSDIGVTAFSVLGTKPFKNGGFPVGLKGGDVATIFRYLITRLHNEVEPMMVDPDTEMIGYGCWAFQYRANVNNPNVLSNHASGTAIDYNAPKHPNGTSVGSNGGGGWTAAQVAKIRSILTDLGGVVRWLSSNDPMHFEIAAGAPAVAAVAARLGRVPDKPGTPNVPDTPNNPPPPQEEDDDMPYSPEQITQFAASGFARGAKTEKLPIGDGPANAGTELTLTEWCKIQNDRIWRLEQAMGSSPR